MNSPHSIAESLLKSSEFKELLSENSKEVLLLIFRYPSTAQSKLLKKLPNIVPVDWLKDIGSVRRTIDRHFLAGALCRFQKEGYPEPAYSNFIQAFHPQIEGNFTPKVFEALAHNPAVSGWLVMKNRWASQKVKAQLAKTVLADPHALIRKWFVYNENLNCIEHSAGFVEFDRLFGAMVPEFLSADDFKTLICTKLLKWLGDRRSCRDFLDLLRYRTALPLTAGTIRFIWDFFDKASVVHEIWFSDLLQNAPADILLDAVKMTDPRTLISRIHVQPVELSHMEVAMSKIGQYLQDNSLFGSDENNFTWFKHNFRRKFPKDYSRIFSNFDVAQKML